MARKKHRVRKHSEFKPDKEEKQEDTLKSTGKSPKETPEGKTEESKSSKPEPAESETHIRISVILFALFGIGVGYLSLILSAMIGNIYTILAGIVIAWLASKVIQLALGRKQFKWLLGNGLVIYLFVWLISWIFFYNYLGLAA
jgi:hypothetical protein